MSPTPFEKSSFPPDGTVLRSPVRAAEPVLAVGAELKNAPCLLVGDEARLCDDLGPMDDPRTYRRFLSAVDRLYALAEPAVVACDAHPAYAATRHARTLPGRRVEVQHHHAHVVACLAEHGLTGEVVSIAADGTGWGDDGTVWGGEVLLADEQTYRRAGRLRTMALPGGDAAAVETHRPAAAAVWEAFGPDWPDQAKQCFAHVDAGALTLVRRLLGNPPSGALRTSSTGRLFDASAFLLGLCDRNDTEAAAPISLQQAAQRSDDDVDPLPFELRQTDDLLELDWRPTVRALVAGRAEGRDVADLAQAFHETMAAMFAEAALRVGRQEGCDRVALTGGCMVNPLLAGGVRGRLQKEGITVFAHETLSPGDASVAFGQAVVAASRTST